MTVAVPECEMVPLRDTDSAPTKCISNGEMEGSLWRTPGGTKQEDGSGKGNDDDDNNDYVHGNYTSLVWIT